MASQNTTPSPVLPSTLTASADLAGLDAEEHAQRQKAIDTFLARTEFSKLARVLRARLSYASYKATHNVAHVPLTSLEHQLASRPAPPPDPSALSPKRKLTHTTMMPPPVQNDGSRLWRSAGMSLYQAVLAPNDPGPAHAPSSVPNGVLNHSRRSRPHHAPVNGHSGQINGRERLSVPGRTVRNVARRRHAHTLSTEREDINAATTLTAIMRGGSTPTTTLSRASSASSTSARPGPEIPASTGGGGRTPQPDDAQAAELMLFLATSPSPARPTTTRSRQSAPQPTPSGLGLGVDPRGPARVLFPSSTDTDSRVQQLPTPESSQMTSTPPPINGSRGAFNLGDYINVSPSPGAAGAGSALPAVSVPDDRADVPLSVWAVADISANLGNAVSKPATQKILLALAERGAITQKTYGKATYFVALQNEADALPATELAELKSELERARETLKEKQLEVKRLGTELTKIRAVPTDAEIEAELANVQVQIDLAENALEPLRAGCQAPVSEADLAKLDARWMRWRNEWLARRKVFKTIWEMRTDTMSRDESERLMEDLGIELDTPEHLELERSTLCTKPSQSTKSTAAKRR
ncbi:hypothetical protein FRC07_005214 [Ceratobasidium sp. 392]|nr:hypothetical protein FRC07_005214 [Ceratobasidium sp. 392]